MVGSTNYYSVYWVLLLIQYSSNAVVTMLVSHIAALIFSE